MTKLKKGLTNVSPFTITRKTKFKEGKAGRKIEIRSILNKKI